MNGYVIWVFDPNDYELVDFGDGRKLERFGGELLDRPSPAAEGTSVSQPHLWDNATARFDIEGRGKGTWSGALAEAASADPGGSEWSIRHGDIHLQLQLGGSGNIGVFPEHAATWDWIASEVRRCEASGEGTRPRVLNLFAYTGGASLAAALAGAEVTHVDSSGPSVAWARRNAEASRATELPVRWLVEDAMKFVARECRRGNQYDGIIADPPTYGHGPKGRAFKFDQHVDELLEACGQLLSGSERSRSRFMLFSCHAPGFGPSRAASALVGVLPAGDGHQITHERLVLGSADGRSLEAGVAARWNSQP